MERTVSPTSTSTLCTAARRRTQEPPLRVAAAACPPRRTRTRRKRPPTHLQTHAFGRRCNGSTRCVLLVMMRGHLLHTDGLFARSTSQASPLNSAPSHHLSDRVLATVRRATNRIRTMHLPRRRSVERRQRTKRRWPRPRRALSTSTSQCSRLTRSTA
ncbi:hypothetical protein DMC30DRAFT_161560 [Rhodotorula diobovata]|uniref:Uncharacterized protein n=1 Tax=Rhodotorula diobovata TaxID=5288 RepID=A0A5C5FJR9_9BASI|nr:hypothetical protein DMC30DRAFT_161560 [Rhodotorula diobovata]